MSDVGRVIVNTGNGKGKTTAALGTAFRALGHGHKVCVVQFLKGQGKYGERLMAEKFDNLDWFICGRGFVFMSLWSSLFRYLLYANMIMMFTEMRIIIRVKRVL